VAHFGLKLANYPVFVSPYRTVFSRAQVGRYW